MRNLALEGRLAFRRLAQDPAVTLLVVLSLSLGIGATTTVFSLVNALLLRPPSGIGEPERLITLTPRPMTIPGLGSGRFHVPISHPSFQAYEETGALAGLAAHLPVVVHVHLGEQVSRLEAEVVTSGYFEVLRTSPARGRFFSAGSALAGEDPDVAVVAHGLWAAWGADPRLVGRVIRLNGAPFTVVGVAPEGFRGTRRGARPEIWVPLSAAPRVVAGIDAAALADPEHGWLFWFVGRLLPGQTPAGAQERLDAIADGLDGSGARAQRRPGLEVHPGVGLRPDEEEAAGQVLVVLMAVAGFLLLIACLNTTVLLVGRSPRRHRETSVQVALGAQRWRIFRQVLGETCLLGGAGFAGGTLICAGAVRALSRIDFAGFLPPAGPVVVDRRVLFFGLALGLGTAILTGLAPALRSSRVDPAMGLRAVRSGTGSGFLQRLLVVAQISITLMLLAGAGLLVWSLRQHQRIVPGFDTENVLNVRFDLARQGYGESGGRAILARVVEEVGALPGVESVSLAAAVPLALEAERNLAQASPSTGPLAGRTEGWIGYNVVGPGYFETLGIPLLRGRSLGAADGMGASAVAVVNQRLADSFWPGVDAVGQSMLVGAQRVLVIGVVANTRTDSLTGPAVPYFYLPIEQSYRPVATLHVRSHLPPASLIAEVKRRIAEIDPRLPLFDQGLMADHLRSALARPRLAAAFVGLAALVGALLSVVGISGVMYRNVAARWWENSVRVALGADRLDVVWLHLRTGLITAGVGIAVGLAGALALSSTLAGFLYGVSPQEPAVLALVAALVLAIALVANAVPAYVATRVDPARVLRQD